LPSEVVEILTQPLSYPKNPRETQTLFAEGEEELRERLGRSGTIIYLPDCDRMSPRKAQTLAEEAIREMGRIYRRFIDRGVRLYINNRRVEPFDPTYWMKSARHTRIEGLTETRSRLVGSWPIDIPVAEDSTKTTRITVRLYALPYEAWSSLPYQAKKDLHLSSDYTVSFLRNDRELEIGSVPLLKLKKHHDNTWLRLEIDFNGEADEGFGVAANKQGVRLKAYVAKPIMEKIGLELITLKKGITELKAKHASLKSGSQVSEAERRASDAEPLQAKQLPEVPVDTPEQRAALEQNLRGLAVTLKRDEETEEQAFERVKSSTYLIATKYDEYRPFYTCEHCYGKVLLTLNSAHPFYQKIWLPLSNLVAKAADISQESHEAADENTSVVAAAAKDVLEELNLLLLQLARTQSELSGHDTQSMNRQLFTTMQRVWSANYATASLAH
jgi:hypothetical protein